MAIAPKSLSLSKAAGGVPLSALSAFQALEKCDPKPGQRCLVLRGALCAALPCAASVSQPGLRKLCPAVFTTHKKAWWLQVLVAAAAGSFS